MPEVDATLTSAARATAIAGDERVLYEPALAEEWRVHGARRTQWEETRIAIAGQLLSDLAIADPLRWATEFSELAAARDRDFDQSNAMLPHELRNRHSFRAIMARVADEIDDPDLNLLAMILLAAWEGGAERLATEVAEAAWVRALSRRATLAAGLCGPAVAASRLPSRNTLTVDRNVADQLGFWAAHWPARDPESLAEELARLLGAVECHLSPPLLGTARAIFTRPLAETLSDLAPNLPVRIRDTLDAWPELRAWQSSGRLERFLERAVMLANAPTDASSGIDHKVRRQVVEREARELRRTVEPYRHGYQPEDWSDTVLADRCDGHPFFDRRLGDGVALVGTRIEPQRGHSGDIDGTSSIDAGCTAPVSEAATPVPEATAPLPDGTMPAAPAIKSTFDRIVVTVSPPTLVIDGAAVDHRGMPHLLRIVAALHRAKGDPIPWTNICAECAFQKRRNQTRDFKEVKAPHLLLAKKLKSNGAG